jgi:hypothetical protein
MKIEKKEVKQQEVGLQKRDEFAKAVYSQTRDPRAAVRAYCQGNKWAEENARAVGNWR